MNANDQVLDRWLQSVSDDEAVRALTHALAVVKVRSELRAQQQQLSPVVENLTQAPVAAPIELPEMVVRAPTASSAAARSRTPTSLMFPIPTGALGIAPPVARRDSIDEQLLVSPRSRLPMLIGVVAVGVIALLALGSLVAAVLRDGRPPAAVIELADPSPRVAASAETAVLRASPAPARALEAVEPPPAATPTPMPLTSAQAVATVRRAQAAAEVREAAHTTRIAEPLTAVPAVEKVPVASAAIRSPPEPAKNVPLQVTKPALEPLAPSKVEPKKKVLVDPLDARN